MIIGRDDKNRVMLVTGSEKRFKSFAEEGWKIIPLKGYIRALFDRTAYIRPVPAGVSIGHVNITAGTHGGVVEYQNRLHGISNSHIVTDNPHISEPPSRLEILQPAPYDKGNVAIHTFAYYVKHAKVSISEKSSCPIANLKDRLYNTFAHGLNRGTRSFSFMMLQQEENTVDAGIYEPLSLGSMCYDVVDDYGRPIEVKYVCGILFAGSTVDNIMVASRADKIEEALGVKFVYDVRIPEVGEIIFKSGRSTGLTYGETIANDMTVSVDYAVGIGTLPNCIVARLKCSGGDSGSFVGIKKA